MFVTRQSAPVGGRRISVTESIAAIDSLSAVVDSSTTTTSASAPGPPSIVIPPQQTSQSYTVASSPRQLELAVPITTRRHSNSTPPVSPRTVLASSSDGSGTKAGPPGSPGPTTTQEGGVPGYHMLERLGKGAFGTVNKALKLEDGTLVAIKTIELELLRSKGIQVEEALKEWSLLRDLRHPNIVKVHGHVKTEKTVSFVFDFVEGGSLYNITKNYGTFPESLVAIYAEQVLQGLAYLHQNGIIHSDVKGANLLIDKTGKVQLADFGIARRVPAVGSSGEAAPAPVDPSALGSPYWMAPEVLLMEDHTYVADNWSVGITIVELLTGDPPYYEMPAMSAMWRIVEDGKPPLPSNLSPDCINFLDLCFLEHAKRPSAKELLTHKWLHQTPNEEKKILAKSLSKKNIYDTIRRLQPIAQSRPHLVPEYSVQDSEITDFLLPIEQKKERLRQLKDIGDFKSEDASGEDDFGSVDLATVKAIARLQAKRQSILSRLANLERNMTAVSRLESLYTWKNKEETSRQRQQRYKNYLQTVEEHIDRVKSGVYIQARAVKDHHPKDTTYLYFNRGDVVYVHHYSNTKGLWTGEKQYETVIGKFPGDCVKMRKKDKKTAKGGSLPRIFAAKKPSTLRPQMTQIVITNAEHALQGLEEDEKEAESRAPNKKQLKAFETQVGELRDEVAVLRAKLQETEAKLQQTEAKVQELEEENKMLRETRRPITPRGKEKRNRKHSSKSGSGRDHHSYESALLSDNTSSPDQSEIEERSSNSGPLPTVRTSLPDYSSNSSSAGEQNDGAISPGMIRAVRTRSKSRKDGRRGDTIS